MEPEVLCAALECAVVKGLSQIITLMELRWSKRRKETINRDGEIGKAVDVDCITTGLHKKKDTEKNENRKLLFYEQLWNISRT